MTDQEARDRRLFVVAEKAGLVVSLIGRGGRAGLESPAAVPGRSTAQALLIAYDELRAALADSEPDVLAFTGRRP